MGAASGTTGARRQRTGTGGPASTCSEAVTRTVTARPRAAAVGMHLLREAAAKMLRCASTRLHFQAESACRPSPCWHLDLYIYNLLWTQWVMQISCRESLA